MANLFAVQNDPSHSSMHLGFQCQDGWLDVIWDLCQELEIASAEFGSSTPRFEIFQVKQKIGEL